MRSPLDDLVVRGFLTILSVAGQFLTVKELVLILVDLASGSVDAKFYLSLVFVAVVFPVSFLFLSRALGGSEFMAYVLRVYGFVVSLFVVGYYCAIIANYPQVFASMGSALAGVPSMLSRDPQQLVLYQVGGILAIFALPVLGLLLFTSRVGPKYGGYASIPLLACFLWGCYVHLGSFRHGFSANFLAVEAPQMFMTMVLVIVGSNLLHAYLRVPISPE